MFTIQHQKSGKLYNYTRAIYHIMRTVPRFFGTRTMHCTICGNRGRFLGFGYPMRFNAVCPTCGALERHRLLRMWMDENTDRLRDARILHFAPEELIRRHLTTLSADYKGCDIREGVADLVLNIEDLDLPDDSIDVIVCCHVLEHVDDAKALAELKRVLVPGGLAILMFPIIEGWDESLEESDLPKPIQSTADRILYFGQHDHVRYYGRDVRDRIRGAGFTLTEHTAVEPYVSEHGLARGETIFLAEKPN